MSISPVRWTRLRLGLILAIFILACGAVLWRAFHLQIVDRERLAQIAEREGHRVITLNPVRGSIFDRQGEKLAASLETDSVFAQPAKIEDPLGVAAQLAKILGHDRQLLADKLKGNDSFIWIKRQISPNESARIEAANMKGIGLLKESKRFYPNNVLAANVLGFVGLDAQGLEGLEAELNDYLRGGVNQVRVKRDALGRTFLDRELGTQEPSRGADVRLTLDRRIQYIAETALAKAVEKFNAKGGLALVVRPRTGEILASAMTPGFNPNVFNRYRADQRRNRIITDTFDPGSTFKVFVVASALEEGLVKPLDLIYCENGSYTISGHIIHDHHEYGWLTVNKIIKFSSNIGSVKIAEKLGPNRLHGYLSSFSFGRKTGLDLPGESVGLLRAPELWHRLDAANVAFGQGVSVTALQMVMAMSALANDGVLMKPYIVSQIVDETGRVLKKNSPEVVRRVVSPQTAGIVREMLRQVVTEGGTGRKADSEWYPAAGKTGTAQKLDTGKKTYSDKKYFSSFLGFVPFNDPQLTIMVSIDEPWPETYGGTVAAPVFREIAQQVLPLLNVPPAAGKPESAPPTVERPGPDRPANTLTVKVDPKVVKEVSLVGEEMMKVQAKAAGTPLLETNFLAEAEAAVAGGIMPDLSGQSMRGVIELMSKFNQACRVMGSGRVVWQEPQPGQALKAGQVCQVKFEQR